MGEGEAKLLVKSVSINESDCLKAWRILHDKFQPKRFDTADANPQRSYAPEDQEGRERFCIDDPRLGR